MRATASYLRENLISLEACMSVANSSINLFNLYVKENMQRFRTHRERSDNLIINLFKEYTAVSGKELTYYIKKKKDKYDKGKYFTSNYLISITLSKYTIIVRDRE